MVQERKTGCILSVDDVLSDGFAAVGMNCFHLQNTKLSRNIHFFGKIDTLQLNERGTRVNPYPSH
jgi:hypothetical protein